MSMLEIALDLLLLVGKTGTLYKCRCGGKASANLYSLVESAKSNDLEPPSAYLKLYLRYWLKQKLLRILPWNINKVVD